MAASLIKPKIPRKIGRPTLFTPDRLAKILESVNLGAADLLCGMAAGVEYGTIRQWVIRGEEEGEGPFYDFAKALEKAKGDRTNRLLGYIETAAKDGTWQAAAWKLERLHSEQYGRTIQRVEHIDAHGNVVVPNQNHQHIHLNVNMDLTRLSDDQLQQFRSSLELISGPNQEAPVEGSIGGSPA